MTPGEPSGEAVAKPAPRRIVALGGGTGLPMVLLGLRRLMADGRASDLTAVVAMSDDGGSSGRLRRTRGLPPPGDVRNCLVSLAAEHDLLAGLFQHRYDGDAELGGHTLGNLILAALAEQTGSFLKAVEVSSRVLRTRGRILPVTTEVVSLEAELNDGSRLVGESAIGGCRKGIRRIRLRPATARATPGVVKAILEADLVVIGPGSLFTSVLPNLALVEVSRALRETRAVRVLVANLVSERGEASGLAIEDHLALIEKHCRGSVVDAVLAQDGPVDDEICGRYRDEGSTMLTALTNLNGSVRVSRRDLLAAGPKLRHDPDRTAAGLFAVWSELSPSAVPSSDDRSSNAVQGGTGWRSG